MAATADARVTRIVIDAKVSPAFDGARFGAAGQYETIAGRAFGELDPKDRRNAVIQDIALAPRNARGMVEYMATFQLAKPVDMTKASGLMWHDVPNRARRTAIVPMERGTGDLGLTSGWQGDNAGRTAPGPDNDYVVVPVAKNPDGSAIAGRDSAREENIRAAEDHVPQRQAQGRPDRMRGGAAQPTGGAGHHHNQLPCKMGADSRLAV